MSHLDTAYQLGVKKAEEDFQAELQKTAVLPLPPPIPARKEPGNTVPPARSSVPVGSAAEAVRGSTASGLGTASRKTLQGTQAPVKPLPLR